MRQPSNVVSRGHVNGINVSICAVPTDTTINLGLEDKYKWRDVTYVVYLNNLELLRIVRNERFTEARVTTPYRPGVTVLKLPLMPDALAEYVEYALHIEGIVKRMENETI